MKYTLVVTFLLLGITRVFGQIELSTGYAVNKNAASGLPIQIAYDFKLSNRLYTKTQIGYKHLHRYNDFVGATLDANSLEVHQTFSHKIVNRRKYILQPNLGLNYRWYHWKGKIQPPYNALPQRAWVLEFRNRRMILNSYGNDFTDENRINNLGFTIQLQNQFRLSEKIWLHVTPFMEPDNDGSENIGGCYIGLVLKQL